MGSAVVRMGSVEAHTGSVEAHTGSVEAHTGSAEGRMGSAEGHMGSAEGRMGFAEGRMDCLMEGLAVHSYPARNKTLPADGLALEVPDHRPSLVCPGQRMKPKAARIPPLCLIDELLSLALVRPDLS